MQETETVMLTLRDLKELVAEKYSIDPANIKTRFYIDVNNEKHSQWSMSFEFECKKLNKNT